MRLGLTIPVHWKLRVKLEILSTGKAVDLGDSQELAMKFVMMLMTLPRRSI